MPDNHAEATTYIKYGPGEGGVSGDGYSYNSLISSFSDVYTDQDQLEVIRIFDTTTVPTLVTDPPDGGERESMYILKNAASSGSPMYTLDTANKKVVFNTDTSNYLWLSNTHHNRGLNVQLPVIDPVSDTVIIRRRTPSLVPQMTWTGGAKVTARGLNAQADQMLNLVQELRTYELNPVLFDFRRGAPNGICPLDANGVIALKYISEQLGGQGVLAVDLSDSVIEDLKDVDIDEASLVDGHVLTWDNPTQNWTNVEPLSKTLDLSTTTNQQVLKWTGSTWDLDLLSLEQVGNVDITLSSLETSNIIYYDAASSTWKNSGVVLHEGSLTNDHVLTWNYSLGKWESKVRPDITYEVFTLSSTSVYTLADVAQSTQATGVVEGDVLAWFDNTDFPHTWRDKSLDTWDLNNIWRGDADITDPTQPGYSGGQEFAALFNYYKKGWVMFWDPDLSQKDTYGTVRGSFHAAPIFAGPRYEDGTPHCDFANASNNWVIKWKNAVDGDDEDKWILAGLDVNHLTDVHARRYDYPSLSSSAPPRDGDILVWSEVTTNNGTYFVWKATDGPGVDGTIGTHMDEFRSNHRFDILVDKNNLNTGSLHAGVWFDAWAVSHKKLRFDSWEMISNEYCRCRIRIYKTDYNNYWNPYAWTELTGTSHVLGWGQGGGSNARLRRESSPSWSFSNNIVRRGDILVFEVQNFQDTGGTGANVLHLNIIWDILEF
jgi:hypothetical protein